MMLMLSLTYHSQVSSTQSQNQFGISMLWTLFGQTYTIMPPRQIAYYATNAGRNVMAQQY